MMRAVPGIDAARRSTVRVCDRAGTHLGQGLLLDLDGEEQVVLTCHHVIAPLGQDDLCVAIRQDNGQPGEAIPARYDEEQSCPQKDAVVLRVNRARLPQRPRPLLHALNSRTYAGSLRATCLTYLEPDNFTARVEAPTRLAVTVQAPSHWPNSPDRYELPVAFRLANPSDARPGISGAVVFCQGGVLGLAHFARAAAADHEREVYLVPLPVWAEGCPALAALIQPLETADGIIYRYLQLPAHAQLAREAMDFTHLVAEKTEGFVGRQFVFDALDEFLKKNRSGYFVIQGEPGIGKTALLAQLVKTRGYPHHFTVAGSNIRTPRQFRANACAQVIARYDLPHDFLPDDATEHSNFLVRCLGEAAAKPENRPVVLVVDALDESEYRNLDPRVNVLYLPRSLPEGAYVVVTSRPLDDLKLETSNQQQLFVEPSSDGNLLDIRTYVEDFLQSDDSLRARLTERGETEDVFVNTLVNKSEGNFIYLRYVLPAIAEGRTIPTKVAELPQGLSQYYRGHWSQMQIANPDEFNELYAPIVCVLAVVREPVTVDQLHKWTNKDRASIWRAIAQWREFLEEEIAGGVEKYRLYHASFQDFLATMVDLKQFDRMIGKGALARWKKG